MSFHQRVLDLTKKIPKGRVTTYKIIAQKLGTKACRAVGNALNKNKDPITIPCNRVVNSDATLGGYSKGIKKKIEKLESEGIKVKDNKIINFKELLYKF